MYTKRFSWNGSKYPKLDIVCILFHKVHTVNVLLSITVEGYACFSKWQKSETEQTHQLCTWLFSHDLHPNSEMQELSKQKRDSFPVTFIFAKLTQMKITSDCMSSNL